MNREERVKKAVDFKDSNKHNCSQAILLAYSDFLGISDKSLLLKISEGFGFGNGCGDGICGAITGAIGVAGIKYASGNIDGTTTKSNTYKISREIMQTFEKMNESTVCRDLKGLDTKVMLRSCNGCVEDACNILESIMERQQ